MSLKKCPICLSIDLTSILSLRDAPIYPVVYAGKQDNVLTDLEFVSCNRCGHIYNGADASTAVKSLITQDIPWFLQVTEAQKEYARKAVDWIGKDIVSGKKILEIGGASGAMTEILAEDAREVVLLEPNKGFERQLQKNSNIRFIEGVFPDDLPDEKFDLIICQHVLGQVPDPTLFMAAIRNHLTSGGHLYVGTGFADYIANHASICSFSFQSQNIFFKTAFLTLVEKVGFHVERTRAEEQNVGFFASPVEPKSVENVLRGLPEIVKDLAKRLASQKENGRKLLSNLEGKIAIYGASAGAQSFLSIYPDIENVVMAFDDTECFEGLEIPKKGKGIPIMRPKKELLSDIDTVIICCFQHDLQISEKLKKIGFSGTVLTLRAGLDAGVDGRPASLFH